jgi:hypothetical protein
VGTSIEFIIAPLITTTGFYLSNSSYEPFPNCQVGIVTFAALIAHPSTGKTLALNIVKKAMNTVQKYFNPECRNSQIANIATVECLFDYLDKANSKIIGIKLLNFRYKL